MYVQTSVVLIHELLFHQLANPSRLISNPPPPIYPAAPALFQSQTPQGGPSAQKIATTNSIASTSTPTTVPTVITNPQSFVVSLGTQPSYPQQYPMYIPAAPYPSAPYYQYASYAAPGPAYYPTSQPQQQQQQQSPQQSPPQQQQQQQQPPPTPTIQQTQQPATTPTATTIPATIGGNQGAWTEDETEQLRKLAEQSRNTGTSGEIEWDWVVHQWGNGRTRCDPYYHYFHSPLDDQRMFCLGIKSSSKLQQWDSKKVPPVGLNGDEVM